MVIHATPGGLKANLANPIPHASIIFILGTRARVKARPPWVAARGPGPERTRTPAGTYVHALLLVETGCPRRPELYAVRCYCCRAGHVYGS
jgi:hypothetical protein